jgi:hypothetical protein
VQPTQLGVQSKVDPIEAMRLITRVSARFLADHMPELSGSSGAVPPAPPGSSSQLAVSNPGEAGAERGAVARTAADTKAQLEPPEVQKGTQGAAGTEPRAGRRRGPPDHVPLPVSAELAASLRARSAGSAAPTGDADAAAASAKEGRGPCDPFEALKFPVQECEREVYGQLVGPAAVKLVVQP